MSSRICLRMPAVNGMPADPEEIMAEVGEIPAIGTKIMIDDDIYPVNNVIRRLSIYPHRNAFGITRAGAEQVFVFLGHPLRNVSL